MSFFIDERMGKQKPLRGMLKGGNGQVPLLDRFRTFQKLKPALKLLVMTSSLFR